jgi:hypothetical protein
MRCASSVKFGEALARYRGQPTPVRFAQWDEAVAELMRIADQGDPVIAVIDEFPSSPRLRRLSRRSCNAFSTLLAGAPTASLVKDLSAKCSSDQASAGHGGAERRT